MNSLRLTQIGSDRMRADCFKGCFITLTDDSRTFSSRRFMSVIDREKIKSERWVFTAYSLTIFSPSSSSLPRQSSALLDSTIVETRARPTKVIQRRNRFDLMGINHFIRLHSVFFGVNTYCSRHLISTAVRTIYLK